MSIEKLATDLQDVQQERDIAIATLNKHGLASDCHVTDHMTELQQQNKELQNVIKQMRQDMEQVTNKDVSMPTTGYTEYIESEMVRLKAENRQLSERLMKSLGKPPSPGVPQVTKKQHQSHLIALSDTIANLQREKAALELTVTQLRSRMEELERELTAEKEQVSQTHTHTHTHTNSVCTHAHLTAGLYNNTGIHFESLSSTRDKAPS